MRGDDADNLKRHFELVRAGVGDRIVDAYSVCSATITMTFVRWRASTSGCGLILSQGEAPGGRRRRDLLRLVARSRLGRSRRRDRPPRAGRTGGCRGRTLPGFAGTARLYSRAMIAAAIMILTETRLVAA